MENFNFKQLWVKAGILFLLIFCSLLIHAKEYTTDNIPNVHIQDKTQYISNPDNILSIQTCDSINRMLYTLEQKTGIETAVIVVSSIGEEDCFNFAFNLFSKWGIGKKEKDNGLIILLVTDQRCIQFVTGYGLEGDLPDAICKRIQNRDMIPYLKENKWDEGMTAGIKAVCSRLDGTMINDSSENGEGNSNPLLIILAIIGFIVVSLFAGMYAMWQANKCPVCHQHKLQRSDSRVISRQKGVQKEEITYTCRNCGHKTTRISESYYDDNHHRGGNGGPFIGGFGGGFGGGSGGFGGGSFGGGMSGGGGAGSRF